MERRADHPRDQTDELSLRELVDAIWDDQRRRFAAGEHPLAEEYLQQHPVIAKVERLAVDVIYAEFVLRAEMGAALTPADFTRRFPQYAALLERQFAVFEAMQEIRNDQETSAIARQDTFVEASEPLPGRAAGPLCRWPGFPVLGNYDIQDAIGEGGMGTVFRALHRSMQRPVAVKILPPHLMQDEQAVARFHREMQVVGQLDHPNIVRATDAGTLHGVHHLVMELVEGVDLANLCASYRTTTTGEHSDRCECALPVTEACELIRQAAIGLEHAHRIGLVHRDIKPSNLMLAVGAQGSDVNQSENRSQNPPVVKILDLGLARLGDVHHVARRELTNSGLLMGTLDYMAPEQGGDSHDVDARADIYSLGATLFKLLSNEPPFSAKTYNTPLKLLKALAIEQAPSIATRRRDLPRKLTAIVDRMLAHDRADRFGSAKEVAEALAPFAEGADLNALYMSAAGVPVAISGPRKTIVTSAGKARRTKSAVAVCILLLLGMAGAAFAPAMYRLATNQGLLVIETSEPDVEVTIKRNGGQIRILDRKSGKRIALKAGKYHIELSRGGEGLRLSTDRFTLDRGGKQIVSVLFEPRRAKPSSPEPRDQASVSRQPLAPNVNPSDLQQVWQLKADVESHLKVDPAALEARELRHRLSNYWRHHRAEPQATEVAELTARLTWPSDLLQRSGIDDYEQAILDHETSWPGMKDVVAVVGSSRLKCWGPTFELAFSPDGRLIATAGADQELNIWEADSGRLLQTLTTGFLYTTAFVPGSERVVAYGGLGDTVDFLDLETGETTATIPTGFVHHIAFSPDGTRMATCCQDPIARIWNVETGQVIHTLQGHTDIVRQTAFSPDGRLLASAGNDHQIRIWNVTTGGELRTLTGHKERVHCVAFSPDGNQLASGSFQPSVRLWNPHTADLRRTLDGHPNFVNDVEFSHDGRLIGSAGLDGIVRLWNAETGKLIKTFTGHQEAVHCVAFDPKSNRMASTGWGGSIQLWDTSTLECQTPGEDSLAIAAGSDFHPSGDVLATAMWNGDIRLWELPECRVGAVLSHHQRRVHSVWFTSNGESIISAGEDGNICTWDVAAESLTSSFKSESSEIRRMVISPNDRRVAVGSSDGAVLVYDNRTGELTHNFVGHTAKVEALAFRPDGQLLASGGLDQTVRLWDMTTGKCLDVLPQRVNVFAITFADRNRVVIGGGQTWQSGFLRVVDTSNSRLLEDVPGHELEVHGLAFRRDGKQFATAALDGRIRLWKWPEIRLLRTIDMHAPFGALLRVIYSPEGRHIVTIGPKGVAYVLRLDDIQAVE